MKRVLALTLLAMLAFLLSSCVLDPTTTSATTTSTTSATTTSTTSSATVPQGFSRSDAIDALERYAERILDLTAYYPNGNSIPDNVASTAIPRDELFPLPASTGTSWMNDTWQVAVDLAAWLSNCVATDDLDVCLILEDGIEINIRYAVSDGWLKFETLKIQSFLIESNVLRLLTYQGLELNLVSDDIAFRHRTIGPVEETLDQPERMSQVVYHEGGDYEYWQWTPVTLTKTTHDVEAEISTTVRLDPLNGLSVRKFFFAEDTAYMGSFDTQEQLMSQTVVFGLAPSTLVLTQSAEAPDIAILEWNAMSVGGWDRLVFDADSRASLFQGETEITGDFFVFANVWDRHTNARLLRTLPLSEVDETVLALSEWGLSFEDVTLDELAGGLGVIPSLGFDWIVAEGFSFDRETILEQLRERIVVAIDEAWIASLLEN